MSSQGLSVSGVDFRITQNAENHLTSLYELVHLDNPSVVLRRGQVFTIQVNFRNGNFDPNVHRLSIIFDFDTNQPRTIVNGTRGEARVNAEARFGWKATLVESNANQAVVKVISPPTALVGEWVVKFVTKHQHGRENEFRYRGKVYLLFNPWNPADQVHMPERRLLDEFVYNDIGKIYQKIGSVVLGQHWTYGQFDKSALRAAMKALNSSDLPPHRRGDPVQVARTVSYMANASSSRNGILEGLWPAGGRFPKPCTEPTEWTSSIDIVEEYLRKGDGESVKYGQCWVFAGLVTTICRALGMPTRNVTAIDCPHDGDFDMAISKFFNENNVRTIHTIYNTGKDTTWSFHVWNETWIQRPDLPQGYGGWQAFDGTPQDMREGKYQCGPAPVNAVKRGEIGMPHDVKAFIAATNADLIQWKETNGQFRIIKTETDKYCTAMYTKQPYTFDPNGDTDRMDIIANYKFTEGSQSERTFLMHAVRQDPAARAIYNIQPQSWRNDLEVKMSNVPYVPLGQELTIPLKVKNKSGVNRAISVSIIADSMYYNGMKGHFLGKVEGRYNLGPGREQTISLRLVQSDYVEKLVEFGSVNVYGAVTIPDTNHTWIEELNTGFQVPKINFLPPQNVRMGRQNTLRMNFRNPMNETLTGCKFRFFAPGLTIAREITFRNVNPNEEIRFEVYYQPVKQGLHTLTATFVSREIPDFKGRVQIRV